MAVITDDMVQASYDIAKQVYTRALSEETGVERLHTEYGMNESSAAYYIHNYICMMNGAEYQKTMKMVATVYFLTKILVDNGYQALATALESVRKHLEYQESHEYNNLVNIKTVYQTFLGVNKGGKA